MQPDLGESHKLCWYQVAWWLLPGLASMNSLPQWSEKSWKGPVPSHYLLVTETIPVVVAQQWPLKCISL